MITVNDRGSRDILALIFSFIDLKEYPILFKVCTLWNQIAQEIYDKTYFKDAKNLSGKSSLVWQKADNVKFRCFFVNEHFFLLENKSLKACLLISRSNFIEIELIDHQFHGSYGNFLIFSSQLKLIALDSTSGEKITECDLSKHYPAPDNQLIKLSPIDQNGQCQIIDQHYHLFFIKINVDKDNLKIECTKNFDLSKLLTIPTKRKFLSAHFKKNHLIIQYQKKKSYFEGLFYGQYVITYNDNSFDYTHTSAALIKPHFFSLNKFFRTYLSNTTSEQILLLQESVSKKAPIIWRKIVSKPHSISLYGNSIVLISTDNKTGWVINSFNEEGKKTEVKIQNTQKLKTKIYHKSRLFLFFEKLFYIYNPDKAQLEGNLNGYVFHLQEGIIIDKPIFLPNGVYFSFSADNPTRSGIVGFNVPLDTPIQQQMPPQIKPAIQYKAPYLPTSLSPQKLLILKVSIITAAIFSLISLAVFFSSLGLNSLNLEISMAVISSISSFLSLGLLLYKAKEIHRVDQYNHLMARFSHDHP